MSSVTIDVPAPELVVVKEQPVVETDSGIEELGHITVKEELKSIDEQEIVLTEEKVSLIQEKIPQSGTQICVESRNNLWHHVINKHVSVEETRIFKCTKCEYRAKVNRQLKLHIAAVHSDVITCETCGSQYKRGSIHFIYCRYFNKELQAFECDSCHCWTKKRFRFKNHLIQHTDPEHQSWQYCEFCPYKIHTKGLLKRHMKSKHVEEAKLSVSLEKVSELAVKEEPLAEEQNFVIEELANINVQDELTIEKHEVVVKDESSKVPPIQEEFLQSKALKRFKCSECEAELANRRNLTTHVRFVHRKVRKFHCKHCPVKCKNITNLKDHVNSFHTAPDKTQWFHCQHCDYKCKNKDGLRAHYRNKHISEKKTRIFQCPQCEYKAKVRSQLNVHISSVHRDGIKCESCGVQYRRLDIHIVSCRYFNKDTQSFECGSCDYKTPIRAKFRRHVTTKHTDTVRGKRTAPKDGIWLYCEFCPYKVLGSFSLKRHIAYKHDEEVDMHVCELCPYGTRFKKCLTQHIRREHS